MYPVTVVITSYNQARTLEWLLACLERQTVLNTLHKSPDKSPFEVVVADDGSSDATADLCKTKRNYPLRWVTQEDQGYRKSKILNQALRHAQGAYVIFLDADVLVGRHFVEDHLTLRRLGYFVCGRRVDLGPKISENLRLEAIQKGHYDGLNLSVLWSGLQGDSQNVKRGWRVTSPGLRKFLGYDRPLDILGSNFSAWRSDLVEVNGFNEALEAYWGEDGDLFIRLRNLGRTSIGAKGMCIQFHIYHPRRVPTAPQTQAYASLLRDSEYRWALQGLAMGKIGHE